MNEKRHLIYFRIPPDKLIIFFSRQALCRNTVNAVERVRRNYRVIVSKTQSRFAPLVAVDKNIELIEKFLTALQKAIKYLDETDKAVVAESILKQFPGTALTSVKDSLESYLSIDAWTKNTAMTEEAFNNLQSVMENAGELDKRADYNAIAYNDIAEKVYKKIYA
mgnify:CR=1 FL=1